MPLFETVVPPGTMLIESSGSVQLIPPPPVEVLPLPETATDMVALELIGPLNAVALAVMTVVPAPTAITSPVDPTVATEGVAEDQVTEFVMFCVEGWFAL